MAPATGGWFFEMGGLSLWSLNSWLMASTCRKERGSEEWMALCSADQNKACMHN